MSEKTPFTLLNYVTQLFLAFDINRRKNRNSSITSNDPVGATGTPNKFTKPSTHTNYQTPC